MLVFRTGIHEVLVEIANREDPDQTALIRVCAVCLGLFGRQLQRGPTDVEDAPAPAR